MSKLKALVSSIFIFLLFLGISFSNGLRFKKNTVTEEIIEYDDVQRVVKKVKRLPASNPSATAHDLDSVVKPAVDEDSDELINDLESEIIDEDTHFNGGVQGSSAPSNKSHFSPANFRSQGQDFRGSATDLSNAQMLDGKSLESAQSESRSETENIANGYTISNVGGVVHEQGNRLPANKIPQQVSFKISSITVENGVLILQGSNLDAVKKISVAGSSVSASLVKTSSTADRIVAMGLTGIQFAMGKIYNVIISDAYASETFPIEFKLSDGSITPRKLAALSSGEDGFVLKWDAIGETWVAAPDEVGAGPDGGITSITKGAGLVGQGDIIETTGLIEVNIGTGPQQIPQFDADKKLLLNSDNSLSFKNDTFDEFVFGFSTAGEFELSKINELDETKLFQVVGDEVLINGQKVCLSGGDNCPTTGGDYVSSINVNPPFIASGTDTVTLSLSIDNNTLALNGSNQLTIKDAAITNAKLSQMGATDGQVLKWTATGWVAADDNNTLPTAEADPKVRAFAHRDQAEPPSCDTHQTLSYVAAPVESFICVDIVLNASQVDQAVSAAVEDLIINGITDVAPSQNAVFDALALKQDNITAASDITLKYLKLMTDGAFWVGLKAPALTAANLTFTLPATTGTAGQVLKTDGAGNLGWVNANEGSVTSVAAVAPLVSSASGGATTISLASDGITNSHINSSAAISWSKIDKTNSTQIIAGTGLLGGGDLAADRTLSIDVGTTAGKIVQLDTEGKLPALDGSNLTNVSQWVDEATGISYTGGNVGIGTTTPGAPLEIDQSVAGNIAIFKTGDGDNSGAKIWASADNGVFSLYDSFGGETLRLSSHSVAGHSFFSATNVGIGTSNPATKLEVRSTTQDASASALRLSSSDGTFAVNQELQMEFAQNTNVISKMGMNYFGPDWGFNFYGYNSGLNPTPIMSMRGNGNVGIGTTNPTTKLEVDGVIKATGFLGPMTSTAVSSGAGSSAAPSYTFSNSASTGLYSSATGVVSISSEGTNTFNFTGSGLSSPTTGGASIGSVAGTSANPTFSFAGDEDTGWYSPLADTLAAATGGVERVRITSDGKMGVGPTAPTSDLQVSKVAGPGGTHTLYSQYLQSSGGAGLTFNRFSFDMNNGTSSRVTYGAIDASVLNNTVAAEQGLLRFLTMRSGTLTEALRILNSGNVGIGTVSPSHKLDVAGTLHVGTTSTTGLLFNPANDRLSISSLSTLEKSGANLLIGGSGYNNQIFYTSDLERLRINASGDVGIGTTAPGSILTVAGATPEATVIPQSRNSITLFGSGSSYFQGRDVTNDIEFMMGTSTATEVFSGSITAHDYALRTGNTPRMIIKHPTGDVGIGVASPTSRLDVAGDIRSSTKLRVGSGEAGVRTSGNDIVLVDALDNTSFRGTRSPSSWSPGLDSQWFQVGNANDAVTFSTAGGTAASRIKMATSVFQVAPSTGSNVPTGIFEVSNNSTGLLNVLLNGNVGMGTTAPSEKLEVVGNVKAQAYLYTSDARLKTNVQTYGNALMKILSLRGVHFDWIANGKPEIGFIAQEVEEIEPNLVVTSEIDGVKSVKYANIVAILVEAFKEQQQKVEENKKLFMVMHSGLESRVRSLEREVASLKEENLRLKEDLELIKKHLNIK